MASCSLGAPDPDPFSALSLLRSRLLIASPRSGFSEAILAIFAAKSCLVSLEAASKFAFPVRARVPALHSVGAVAATTTWSGSLLVAASFATASFEAKRTKQAVFNLEACSRSLSRSLLASSLALASSRSCRAARSLLARSMSAASALCSRGKPFSVKATGATRSLGWFLTGRGKTGYGSSSTLATDSFRSLRNLTHLQIISMPCSTAMLSITTAHIMDTSPSLLAARTSATTISSRVNTPLCK
mmetsp:Transcript_27060/g.62557  ORF Transcript_27060/g.62557 Transcript_27060/m.62557 type:complete len:244 (-) Transcript_27060:120-851(-)